MSNTLLKEDDVDNPMNYALDTLDPATFLQQFSFKQIKPGVWWRTHNGYDHQVTLENGMIYYTVANEGAAHPFSAGRVSTVADLRRRVQLENLDDDVDVESYVQKSLSPETTLKELGFKFSGASEDGTKNMWLRRLGRGWYESVNVNNETQEIVYRKLKMHGRGIGSEFTVHDYKTHATMNDVRRRVLKWKHEDAQEVVARLLDSTPDNPDAFEPHAVLEHMAPHRCPECRSHNIRGDIAEGITDCYNCGTAFSTDRIQEDDTDDPEAFIRNLPVIVPRITISFSQTTPESSEHGEHSATGWIDEEGVDMSPDSFDYEEGVSAVDKAVEFLQDKGATIPSSSHFHTGVWYSTDSHTIDYRTGTDEERNYFLKDFSAAEERAVWDKLH